MKIAIIDKDQFAGLLRYGEIILPNYSISRISDDLPEKEAIKLILSDGNPIEFPSQYIILRFESEDDKLKITSVKSLMATDAESLKLFSMQFRQDLFIQPAEYSDIFSEYLQNTLQKNKILKGIISFRTLCGLDISGDYSDYVNMIYQGINNRLKYRHHYQLPPEEREKPYSLMISYDRHSPYPKGWTGYYCDVIEVYCYYDKPDLGYSDAIAENTKIYESIIKTGPNAKSKEINEAIKNENFVKKCNEFFNLPGGYLVPYIFFILRDIFRSVDSYAEKSDLIKQIKNTFTEAFDTASIFVGGFFGYDKFYEEYYSALDLPFLRRIESKSKSEPESYSASKSQSESVKDVHLSEEKFEDRFIDGTTLYKELFNLIDSCLNSENHREKEDKKNLCKGLTTWKNNEEKLKEIQKVLLCPTVDIDSITALFSLKKYPRKSIKKICEEYQRLQNK